MKSSTPTNGQREPPSGSGGGSASTATTAFDMAAFARALPGGTAPPYGHGHSASMSSLPQHLTAPGNSSGSPGHAHSRSVSHNRDGPGKSGPTPSSSGPSTGPAGTPNVFDGSVRRGTCKFFNSQKGYGFINDARAHELNGEEVFVHYTAITGKSGFRSLAEGEDCEYSLVPGPKGYQATNVTGPGGQPVAGDPKARLPKAPTTPGSQVAQIPMTPYAGFADPYTHHYAAMFGAGVPNPFAPYGFAPSPYMHPQQLQAHAAALAAAAAAAAAAAGVSPPGTTPSGSTATPSAAAYPSPLPQSTGSTAQAGQAAVAAAAPQQHIFTPFGGAAGAYPWGSPSVSGGAASTAEPPSSSGAAGSNAAFSPFIDRNATSPILAPNHVHAAHGSANYGRDSPATGLGLDRRYRGPGGGNASAFSAAVGSASTPPIDGQALYSTQGSYH